MKRIITIWVLSVLVNLAFAQTGNFGIGTSSPSQKLDVDGWIELGDETTGAAGTTGTIRYNSSGKVQYYNGSQWVDIFSATNTDGDNDPNNESISSISLSGNLLQIVDAAGTHSVNLNSLINDADADPNNEFQTISKSGNTVTLSNGGGSFTDAVEDGDWTRSGSDLISGPSGNVGIGSSPPAAKLDVNGTVKATGVQYPDGSTQTRKPRTIHTVDPRGGCPPAHAANTDLFTQTFSLSSTASVSTHAAIIRSGSGRHDLMLYVDGVQRDITLTYTSSTQWEDAHVQWSGVLAPGNHTISIRGNTSNVWGCQSSWGSIDTIIYE